MKNFILAVALVLACGQVYSSEMVYMPVNPSFGGNPMNGSTLLATANAINTHADPKTAANTSMAQKSPLQQFNDTLQQYVLSRISSSVSGSLFGANGQLIPGTVQTQDFIINIVSMGNAAMQITTTDKKTGQSTMFQIGQ
jgi:curli production assembly/transport component CsgF